MKRRDLIKLLEKNGWTFKRAGGNHDVYARGNEREAVEPVSYTHLDVYKRQS